MKIWIRKLDTFWIFSFEKEKIKDILLYQRKLKYLKDLEKNLIKNAKEKGEIKYYY